MLKEEKIYRVKIIDLGHTGEGIGKIDGIPIFVDGALIGDEVEVEVCKRKKNYAVGRLLRVWKPSDNRVEAVCTVASICGGCQIMQMEYSKQLELKRTIVQETLKRIGGITDVEMREVLGMSFPYHYRNKSQYPIRKLDSDIKMGFFEKKTHNIVPIDACPIDDEQSVEFIARIKKWAVEESIVIYDEVKDQGNLRQVIFRTAVHSKQYMIILVTRKAEKLPVETLVDSLGERLDKASFTIIQNINDRKTNVIMGKTNRVLYGQGYIVEKLQRLFYNAKSRCYQKDNGEEALRYRIYPSSFFQVNTSQTELLYSIVLDYASPTASDVIFDLYCGLGSISLFLAKSAKMVYGVEIVEEAIYGAKENAALNRIENTEFVAGKTEEILPIWVQQGKYPNIVVLDPPRKGCEESVLQTILKVCPEKIVYVSCNPATLARDLKILVSGGYRVENVQPVDLFPHTMHVETVVLMSRKDK